MYWCPLFSSSVADLGQKEEFLPLFPIWSHPAATSTAPRTLALLQYIFFTFIPLSELVRHTTAYNSPITATTHYSSLTRSTPSSPRSRSYRRRHCPRARACHWTHQQQPPAVAGACSEFDAEATHHEHAAQLKAEQAPEETRHLPRQNWMSDERQ